MDGLVAYDDADETIPAIAASWDVSPDGLVWTFHIRKGVYFSDGIELTADDVQFTYEKGYDPKYGNRFASFAQVVQSFQAEGKYTFKIILKHAFGLLPDLLGRSIVPRHLLQGGGSADEDYGKHPVGTGPFSLAEWKPGQLTFNANPRYFRGKPHLDRVIFKLFPDNKKAWVSLMQGETDFVPEVDYEDYALIKNDPRFKGYEYLDNFCYSLMFNTRDPLFSDRRLRLALSLIIDRRDLLDVVLQGGGVTTNGPFKPGTWAYNPDPSLQAYDPGRAAKILSDLGWRDTDGDWVLDKNGKKLQFTVLVYGEDKFREASAKRLQWQLLQLGIRMDVEVLPLQELVDKRLPTGTFQAVLIQFNAYSDPDTSASNFWHSSSIGGWNVTSYSNPEVDRLIEQGRITSDFDQRKSIYQRIHALISNDAPAAFLFFNKRYTATSSRLHGVTSPGITYLSGRTQEWYVTK
jgi:peptide/nickel transport system substrate-binding protein